MFSPLTCEHAAFYIACLRRPAQPFSLLFILWHHETHTSVSTCYNYGELFPFLPAEQKYSVFYDNASKEFGIPKWYLQLFLLLVPTQVSTLLSFLYLHKTFSFAKIRLIILLCFSTFTNWLTLYFTVLIKTQLLPFYMFGRFL